MAQSPAMAATSLEGPDQPPPSKRGRSLVNFGRIVLVLALLAYAAALAGAWLALMRFVPDQLSVRLGGHAMHVVNVHAKILSNAMLIFAILPFALWVEWITVGWEESSVRRLLFQRSASMHSDLVILVLGQGRVLDVIGKLMLLGASLISADLVRHALKQATGLWIDPTGVPFVVQLPVYFFVYTFFDYWAHRIYHWRYFWPLHRYHHSAEEFCVVTSERQHPASILIPFVINIPLAVLGADPAVMIYANVLVSTVGLLIHSRIDSDWGWFGRWVIQSPNHHRLHHKLDMSRPTGHFAIAPVWDHLFGTFYGTQGYGRAAPDLPIGVDKPYRHGVWVIPDILRDYADFWRGNLTRRWEP
jgi:sterol desaturase/sphingolipid hydroxylase (fatty acid hydroxylase superfamily)